MAATLSNTDKIINWITTLDLNVLLSSSFGLIGIIIGIFITEYFKRKDRESLHSVDIFRKRLEIYENLYQKMFNASKLVTELLDKNSNLEQDERLQIWNDIALDTLGYMDENALYLNEAVTIHCSLTICSATEMLQSPIDKQKELQTFNTNLKKSYDLIREETGLRRLERFFNKVNKPSINSSYITEFNKIKKNHK